MFHSTRNNELKISFEKAVLNGWAADGGMNMPVEIPVIEIFLK